MTSPLAQSAAQARRLKDDLLTAMPDLAEEEQLLLDTLEGQTDVMEQLAAVVRSAVDDAAMAEGTALQIARLQARKGRLEQRATSKRQVVLSVMADLDIKKLPAPDMTVTRKRTAAKVTIYDRDALPEQYRKQKEWEPNKTALARDLKAGTTISGATLGNRSETLQVKI